MLSEEVETKAAQLSAQDFLLQPEAFIARCAAVLGVPDDLLPSESRNAMIQALKAGKLKLEIVAALSELAEGAGFRRPAARSSRFAQENWTSFIVTDVLANYAPDDDTFFVKQVYAQMFGREPDTSELTEALFELTAKHKDRKTYIEALAIRADLAHRLSPPPRGSEEGGAAGIHNAGDFIDSDGKRGIMLIKHAPPYGWFVNPSVWVQHFEIEDGMPKIAPGRVIGGPKRSLDSGRWALKVEIIQDSRSEMMLDVVANGGADRLLSVGILGPIFGQFSFEVEKEHHFIEVRLHKFEAKAAAERAMIRNITLYKL